MPFKSDASRLVINAVFIYHPANTRTMRYKVEERNLNIAMPATNTSISGDPCLSLRSLKMTSMYIPVRFDPDPLNVEDAVFPDRITLASKAFDKAHSNSSCPISHSHLRILTFVRKLAWESAYTKFRTYVDIFLLLFRQLFSRW